MADGRERARPVAVGPSRRTASRIARMRAARARRRRRIGTAFATALLIVVAVAAVFLGARLWHFINGPVADYRGDGKRDLVIEVHKGDTTTQIAETLKQRGVVATVTAFLDAAHGNAGIASIQDGFYWTRTEIPAAVAVAHLTDPHHRVGLLNIPEGRQLDDTTDVATGKVTPGIFSLISEASCLDLNGNHHCVAVADLRAAAATGSPAALSVPPWATEQATALDVRAADRHRRVEGLIAPGRWNINPEASAPTVLGTLIAASAARYAQSGLQDTATALDMPPYDVLVVASLVQREANPEDFDKVARVIYNRLAEHRTLEFDSTVNYPLDHREVATRDADRAARTPWNTYLLHGLPATPICSPGSEALGASERPAPGDWLYFVTVDKQGTTLFTRDYQQHLANVELARRNGVLDSAR